ncbi:MAG TPA: DUF5700 domain-containing putative Zn-dependent protease [Thermoanaerobaculia bacterium]|nr:DUF5700 domain-containing putative Zn-dependent protease [Thermoanaerobaculia bacterium]
MKLRSAVALLLVLGSASRAHSPFALAAAPAGKVTPGSPAGKAPYEAETTTTARIDIKIDAKAAREILSSLARLKPETSDVKVLEDIPAIRVAIQDSSRDAAVFERDFAAAWEGETRAAVFDFRSIREKRDRWEVLVEAVLAREADLVRLSQRRAAALLPADRPSAARLEVLFSFGLPGLEDHLVIHSAQGPDRMVIDVARALGDAEGETPEGRVSRLSRLIAGEAFGQAWSHYREESPAWKRSDPELGPLEPFLKVVAAAGPVGLFTVDENFFPLAVWLKDPDKRAVEELNRRAERFASSQENLDARMELLSEVRRPDFARRIAGPIGAFLADAIAQGEGAAGLRTALEQGPRAFFAAYDRATQKDKSLVPLAKAIRDKLK